MGFLPGNDPACNRLNLRRALDLGGTVVVEAPGVYDVDGTLNLGSDTSLVFGNGTAVRICR